LHLTDQTFRILVETIEDYAILLLDPEGVVQSWNAGARRIMGYDAHEIVGRHVSTFYTPEDRAARAWEQGLTAAREHGRHDDVGWRVRKDGSSFWASVVLTALHDDAGRVIGFAKVTHDLTDRTYRAFVEATNAIVWTTDGNGHPNRDSPSWRAFTGQTEEEWRGLRGWEPIHPDDLPALRVDWWRAIQSKQPFVGEFRLRRHDGVYVWVACRAIPFLHQDGSVREWFGVTFDISTRKEAEHERERAIRVKDELLAMLGHELRNPLAPIRTALELMALRADPETAKERQVIERQVDHLVRLVDDLLDVSRITRGMIELHRRPIELGAVIAHALEMASPLLEQRRHHLDIQVPHEGLAVDADPDRLAQVFSNLLANAAKFTDPGGRITVTASRDDREGKRELAVTVQDTGVGIAPELVPSVFETFVQERRTVERSQGGLGLGLSIVRSLVTLHGGTVSVHSEGRGRGAAFTVRLPAFEGALAPEGPARASPGAPPPPRGRILVVDDNEDAAGLLSELLTDSGYDTRVAFDGPTALAIVGQFAPDVAILDIGLPVMDGYELAAELRARLRDRAPRMIALTGYGQEQDQRRATAAGFERYLVKPVALDTLCQAIGELGSPGQQ
jgi:PAS domain S-box-containing protein